MRVRVATVLRSNIHSATSRCDFCMDSMLFQVCLQPYFVRMQLLYCVRECRSTECKAYFAGESSTQSRTPICG